MRCLFMQQKMKGSAFSSKEGKQTHLCSFSGAANRFSFTDLSSRSRASAASDRSHYGIVTKT